MRIISLISSATEIVHSLGCAEMLVGISHECDYPNYIKNLPICSQPRLNPDGSSIEIDNQVRSILQDALSIYRINQDLISKLNPDVIITQSQCQVCAVNLNDVQRALKDMLDIDPQIISLEPKSLDDVWSDIKKIAKKLKKDKVALSMLENINGEITRIKERKKDKNKRTVACIEWIDPLMFAGNWVPEMVDIVDGVDLFGIKGEHSSWSKKHILFEKDPDIIIFMPCGYDIAKTRQEVIKIFGLDEWKNLKSFNSGNVYITDGNQYFNRPGPRLLDSIKILDEIINQSNSFEYFGHGWIGL